jgi:predicted Zn-dependent protease
MRILWIILTGLMCTLSACAPAQQSDGSASAPKTGLNTAISSLPSGQFAKVVSRIEPVAEKLCVDSQKHLNCDFEILVDGSNSTSANAFQTIKEDGRPLVIFTQALINKAQNKDELAFILGHEMAHHLEGHLYRQYQSAGAGAILLGGITALTGASDSLINSAQRIGAGIGVQTYSKAFELEADRLGALLSIRAGFNPMRGSLFFIRMPGPGDQFLGTYPPNSERMETVRSVSLGY